MTKEQEKAYKAVESFKNFIKSKESEQNTLYENEEFYRDDIEQNELFLKMLHTVLNLIKKQQEEIGKLKDKNKELLRKLRNRVKEVRKLTKYSMYKKEFSNLNKRLEKKDKIIDEIEDLCIRKGDDEGQEYGGIIIWNFANKIIGIIKKLKETSDK